MSPSVRDWVPEGHLVWTVLDVGLASVGVVSIDGPKMSANASMNANRDFVQIARAILREAAEIDEREDELYGSDRGDELPEQLRTREGRRRALPEAKEA